MLRPIICTSVIFLALSCTSSSNKATLRIAAAANMIFAIDSISELFENKTGIRSIVSANSSGMLTAQIEKGAPFDLFISANMRYPERLLSRKFGESLEVYAYGRIALVYKKGAKYNSIEEVLASDKINRFAVANPKTAPYGIATMEYLNNTKLLDEFEHKIIYAESIGQVNQYLVSGAVDAAFTSLSFLAKFGDDYSFIEADPGYFTEIKQGMLLLKHGKEQHPSETKKFMKFIKTKKCKEVLSYFGYRVEIESN